MSSKDVDNALSFLQKSRRAHQRFAVSMPVQVIREEVRMEGQMHNLSAGGMFVVFSGQAQLGDRFHCEVSLPGLDTCQVPVEVCWFVPRGSSQYGVGLKFLHLPDRLFKAIVELANDVNLRS